MRDTISKATNVEAVGISADKPERQKRFDDKNELGYTLLYDEDHKVATAFGVWRTRKLAGKTFSIVVRSVFVIDAEGLIEHTFYKLSVSNTAKRLAEVLPLAEV